VLQQERPHLRDGPEGSGRSRPGDLLWPERFPEAEVEKLRLTLQAVGTAGQLQQRPGPEKGTIFKTEFFKHFTLERGPDGELLVVLGLHDPTTGARPPTLAATEFRFFQTCDTALTISEQSAYTAVVTFAWHRVRRWLLIWDVWRHRLDVHEQLPALYELRDGKGTWDPGSRTWIVPGAARRWPRPLILQGVEYKGSGIGIVNEAAAQGKPLVPLKAVTDKVQRAATAATMYGAGQIWHLAGANWLPDLEDELRAFPQGAFADQVDSVSYGANLAVEDALLNASIEGALWMDEPMNSNGLPMTPEDVRLAGRNMEVVHVAGHRIVFDDTDDFGRS
jgi:predicted phage terminase large subunit-like protein